jgi:NhaP-type Na+/H+ or K+/H+ antiporter
MDLTGTVALVGVVIVVASLLSGALDRSGVPVVAVFLALGAMLGPNALGLADVGFESPSLHALSMLALALVLFSDAATMDTRGLSAFRRTVWSVLGPGTLIPAVLIGLAAWALLEVPAAAAAILGAALASTDPVLLRSVLRSPALPEPARLALRMESGMNDVVLLPIVVVSMVLLAPAAHERGLPATLIGLFLLGPALGVLVGWIGIVALDRIRGHFGVRRDYESLYALGLAFTAFALAEGVGGSGFVAAFAAGMVVAAQDVELCECFLEYGEATAEMLLLLTFVALGTALIWSGLDVIGARTLLFAAFALFARTLVLYPVLGRAGMDRRDKSLVALFGPRGLSSLLLVLLPVFAGVPGSRELFAVVCLVVLLSVALHGAGIALFLRAAAADSAGAEGSAMATPGVGGPAPAGGTVAPRPHAAGAGRLAVLSGVPERVTLAELEQLRAAGEPIVLVDARSDKSWRADALIADGAVRMSPDDPVRDATAQRLSQHATLVVYCA